MTDATATAAWECVIGLEVHVQLATATKMFCAQGFAFGADPNALIDPYTLGLPGALPVPNREAIRLATRAALAIGCTVHETSIFARKHYFYPDLPKGYQISQFDRPLATGGAVRIESPTRGRVVVGVTRLHLEEDAGKSLHDRLAGRTAVDLNRAGAPLVEIVSEPDLRSPAEARAYLVALKQLLLYAEVSECSMEKGTLRVDANISIRRPGEARLGTKTELKNLNSFANVERALEIELARQVAEREAGRAIRQVTQLFNAATGEVKVLRSKEDSDDYRYFPDPDLPPLVLAADWIAEQRAALPELPDAKRERLMAAGLPAYHAGVVASERPIAAYFDACVAAGAEPKAAADWLLETAMTDWNEGGTFPVPPARLAALLGLVKDGTIAKAGAKQLYAELKVADAEPKAVAERLGLVQVRDEGALAGWVDEVLAAHPDEVARFRGGEAKLIGFFVGQVMKRSAGKADAKAIQPLLKARLG
ncbi:MAG: Asp-tRNA(Asn)/Glu-tRNA(Gln) amidotransferase subunit GatB [Gemmatimonadales bacterium]|nr:Asp-tRNA(Asn)/Glu-tRNA(Gln) amidotransferase subunit GatB [Gemmatimonadales bacterium]